MLKFSGPVNKMYLTFIVSLLLKVLWLSQRVFVSKSQCFCIAVVSFVSYMHIALSAYVDYIPLNEAEVVFQPGASALQNSTSCINFTIIDDTVVESNETVPLSLSSTLPVITLQASSTATVVIYDPLDCKL